MSTFKGVRTENLAIVFTDIAGFTHLTARQSHAENQRLLRAHAALLEPVFRAFGGRIIKRIGDAYLVAFRSPTKAVLCGAAIEDRLWEFNRRASESLRLSVRVAVNVGEVRLENGDVFGAPVNLASRVEAVAQPGEVLFTEAVWLSMDRGEVAAVDRGRFELRGVPEPVRLYALPRSTGDGPPYGHLGLSRAGKLPEVDPRLVGRSPQLQWKIGLGFALAALSAITLWGGSLRARQATPAEPPPPPPAQQNVVMKARAATAQRPQRAPLPKAVRELVAQLQSSDCDARAKAAEKLGQLGDKRARRHLQALAEAAALPGENPRSIFDCSSRGAAREALSKLGN